jgi:hypothetical protein
MKESVWIPSYKDLWTDIRLHANIFVIYLYIAFLQSTQDT